jgi:carboxymethylenebutenolidase
MKDPGEWVELSVSDGTAMRAYVVRPKRANGAGLIVIQEAFGVNAHIRDVAERFAQEGYLAIAPELYHRTGRGVEISYTDVASAGPHREGLTDERLSADLASAYTWIAGEQVVTKGNIASVGFCMGGRASFLANATLPLRAAVSFYGGRITETLLDRARALSGPQLFVWGGLDTHIPQSSKRPLIDMLDELKKPYVNVDVSYAGHGFFCNERESYSEKGAKQVWPLTLAFLSSYCS